MHWAIITLIAIVSFLIGCRVQWFKMDNTIQDLKVKLRTNKHTQAGTDFVRGWEASNRVIKMEASNKVIKMELAIAKACRLNDIKTIRELKEKLHQAWETQRELHATNRNVTARYQTAEALLKARDIKITYLQNIQIQLHATITVLSEENLSLRECVSRKRKYIRAIKSEANKTIGKLQNRIDVLRCKLRVSILGGTLPEDIQVIIPEKSPYYKSVKGE